MSNLRDELEALRREVAELRTELRAVQSPGGAEPSESEVLAQRVKAAVAKDKESEGVGIGVCQIVVMHDRGGGIHTADHHSLYTGRMKELPPEQKLIEKATAFSPFVMRALHKLLEPFYDGEPMRRTKADLAAALGADEAELEEKLRPLVANGTVRWSKTAAGEEQYELARSDLFLLQLALWA